MAQLLSPGSLRTTYKQNPLSSLHSKALGADHEYTAAQSLPMGQKVKTDLNLTAKPN